MPAEHISAIDNLNQGRVKLNNAIDAANNAETLSVHADQKATQALSNSEQTQTELTQAILAGDSSPLGGQLSVGAEGTVYAGPQERLLAEYNGLTADLADIAVNAKNFGLDENATWQTNRDALQQANDVVASLGGGTVLVPPGEYLAKGILQDARVSFYGEGATIKHPDGSTLDIIRSRVHSTLGSINAGSTSLTVDDASKIEIGALIAIRGASGISPLQFTTLANAIDATQITDITLANPAGYPSSGFLVVESEIIAYTGLSGATLTGVTRGFYGTTATSHSSGINIGFAMRHIVEVLSIDGNTVTIDKPAIQTVSASPVSIGILSPSIYGIKFKGNMIPTGSTTSLNPVRWDLVRFGRFDFSAENAESAIFLGQGSSDCEGVVYAKDCSVPQGSKGSVVWLFQQTHRNKIYANISGDLWAGVYLDNRTTLATEWDGGCHDNTGEIIINGKKQTPFITNTGLLIIGSDRNRFSINAKNIRTGLLIGNDDQINTADNSHPTARGNMVDVRMSEGYQPWVVLAPGNVLTGYWETQTNGSIVDGNLKVASPNSAGENPILGLSPDGTQSRPGMAFANEVNTGFYRISAGQVQFVSQSQLVARFRSTGLMINDGKNLEGGVTNGVKIGGSPSEKWGFWGATPIIRPSGTPVAATDLASTQTLVNYLRTQMINMGLIAPN